MNGKKILKKDKANPAVLIKLTMLNNKCCKNVVDDVMRMVLYNTDYAVEEVIDLQILTKLTAELFHDKKNYKFDTRTN